jgi:hypothetical protein
MTDMTDTSIFIEEKILNSVKKLLTGRVNELLGETEYPIPPVEFGSCRGGSAVAGACSPVLALSACERTLSGWTLPGLVTEQPHMIKIIENRYIFRVYTALPCTHEQQNRGISPSHSYPP